jgi:hypothetical protein
MSRLRTDSVTFRGETFTVREWTAAERSQCLKVRESDVALFAAAVAFRCTVKEDGARYFQSEADAQNEPSALIDALTAKALTLSGIGEDDSKND